MTTILAKANTLCAMDIFGVSKKKDQLVYYQESNYCGGNCNIAKLQGRILQKKMGPGLSGVKVAAGYKYLEVSNVWPKNATCPQHPPPPYQKVITHFFFIY